MAARATHYQRLLAADTSLGVGVGQRALEQLLRAKRLDVESFINTSGPALGRSEKGIVAKQLKLLKLAVKQRPDLAGLLSEVLAPALTHERPDIQEAAWALAGRLKGRQPSPTPGHPEPNSLHEEPAIEARAARSDDPRVRSTLDSIKAGKPRLSWTISAGPGAPLPAP